jgi:hypothetical protein
MARREWVYMKKLFFILLISILLISCGNRRSPTGGPIDDVRPGINYTVPIEFEQITNSEIVIAFSKPMDKTSVMSGLNVSPAIIGKKFVWKKNTLSIQFSEPLPDDTNVVVFLNKSIKCERNNHFPDHQVLVFRNGKLNQNSLSGIINFEEDFYRGRDVNVTLLDSDSLLIFNKILHETNYRFDYLNDGRHTLNAFVDINNNNRFDFAVDASFSRSVVLPISQNININLAIADTVMPNVRTITSIYNNLVHIEFTKELASIPTIHIYNDTLGLAVNIIHREMIEKKLYLVTAPLDSMAYRIQIAPLTDKKGKVSDTLVLSFDSLALPDEAYPNILSIAPRNGTTTRERTPDIVLTFDKIMFVANIDITMREVETNRNISLRPVSNAGKRIVYRPTIDLTEFNSYQVVVSPTTSDNSGNLLLEEVASQFIVVGS